MHYLERHKYFHISQLLLQVFFVGVMLGLFRIVVPALSESEFGVPEQAFFLLAGFIIVFGLVKSVFQLPVEPFFRSVRTQANAGGGLADRFADSIDGRLYRRLVGCDRCDIPAGRQSGIVLVDVTDHEN